MKCKNCGQELMEDALFCVNCGTKIEAEAEENVQNDSAQTEAEAESAAQTTVVEQSVEQPAEQPVEQSVEQSMEQPVEQQLAQSVQQLVEQTVEQPVEQQPEQQKKSANIVLAILGVAALALVALIVLVVVKLTDVLGQGTEKYAVYVKDDKIMYTEDVTKDKEAMEICEVRHDSEDGYWYYQAAKLTDDNKYVYFYDKLSSDGIGRLCRIERDKISKKPEKNEKNMEEISSNVADYTILENSKQVVYRKENGRLVFFDDKKEKDIDSDVSAYYVDQKHKTVLYNKYKDGTEELYVYHLESDSSEKIDSGITNTNYMYDSEFMLYTKAETEDGDGTLYVAKAKGEPEKIAKKVIVEGYDSETKTVYYLQKEEKSEPLYSYVNDVYADSDAGLAEPNAKDYLTEATETDAMSEEEYNYYVVEYPEDKDDFYNWLGYDYELEMYYNYKYTENELGEIQDEIYYYDDTLKKWYRFDRSTYDKDWEVYEGAKDRIELREDLKEENYESTSYKLCRYEAGKEATVLAEDVDLTSLCVNADNQVVFYEKNDPSQVEKVSIDAIYSVYDVWEILEGSEDNEDKNGTYFYRIGSEEEQELKFDGSIGNVAVSDNGKKLVIASDYTENGSVLTVFEKKNGLFEKVEELADNAQAGCWLDEKYYYYKDIDSGDNVGDLCCYRNGKNEKVIKNIYVGGVRIFSDENCLCLSDYNYEDGGDLKLYDSKGEGIKIGSSITSSSYIEEDCILYIKDSDLYVYTGKEESRKIDRNVLNYVCKEEYGTAIY